ACRYFKEAYNHFHNWTLVAASYNMGMGGVAKSMQFQQEDNYYDLGLNTETARYIFRILAFKEIETNPEKFGFFIKHSDMYPPIPIVQIDVDSSIDNLADYALSLRANYHILKILNPWLVSSKLPNPKGVTYTISLPKRDAVFIDLGENIDYNDTARPNQCLIDTSSKVQNSCSSKIIVHFVKENETVEVIAKTYSVTPEQVRSWNSLSDSAALRTDDEVIIFKDTK
ncbi:MAG TPA: LysM peptidoglycan-binding domain-containing protein, partial [Bacteroidia bacterium]|nr:LysM peptidoglycan-binding domain-containing protein [Bacteroidia bacterium]